MGDVVISSTCLQPVREQLPGVFLALAVQRPFLKLFKDNPWIDALVPMPDCSDAFAKTLSDYEFDTAVMLNPSGIADPAIEAARIPVRIGYTKGKGDHLTHWVHYNWKRTGTKHEGLFNFDLLSSIGVKPPTELTPIIYSPENLHSGVLQTQKNIILFHLASYGKKPRVPPAFFVELGRKCMEAYDDDLVIVGGSPEDRSLGPFLEGMHAYRSRIHNLAGKTNITTLSSICNSARLMVSRDSGPAHLAAALGCPTLTFFINSKPLMRPDRWRPLGPSVEIYYKPVPTLPFEPPHNVARRIVRRFDVDEAFALIKRMLLTGRS